MKPLKVLTLAILAHVIVLALASDGRAEISSETGCPVGDLSGDCIVGMEDFLLLAGQWLDPNCIGFECADLTGGGGVNLPDYVLLVNNLGQEVSPLVINEFMASNDTTITDGDGNFSDWVELYNVTQRTFNLDGWYLTDDPGNLNKWAFHGGRVLDPNEYLVLFASGQPTDTYVDPSGFLHTSFKLKADTEYVALVRPDGATIVSEHGTGGNDYPQQVADISYGLFDGVRRYFALPTPGAANVGTFVEFVSDTKFSVDRGFYDAPFSVFITTTTPGATIRYTTSGSAPTATSGTVYSGPISITTTTTLRAAAFKPGFQPTNVDAHTYIFLNDVINQNGTGLPAHADYFCKPTGVSPDWEMDPNIVVESGLFTDGNNTSFDMVDALLAIPTVSLVMDWDDWFSASSPKGIYAHGSEADDESWERVVSAEFFTPDGSEEFQINCAISVIGGSGTRSCKHDKFSLRLKFKGKTDANQDGQVAPGVPTGGPTKLDFPLFPDSPVESFDTLVFDSRMNYAWTYHGNSSPMTQRERAQYTRDQYVANLHLAMDGSSPHGRHVHLYLNGLYWGLYNIHERPDSTFAAEHLGGDKEDYDVLKHNDDEVVAVSVGSGEEAVAIANYAALFTAANLDLTNLANYNALLDVLDIDEFIDYMLANFYVGNTDWAHHNWYATFNRVDPGGKWRYHSWDPEKCLQSGTGDNVTTKNNAGGPSRIHQLLKSSPEYRLLFADHVHKHFFNNGVLATARATALYQKLLDEVDRAVVGESARWGDNSRTEPYRREVEWVAERDRLLGTWFPVRSATVLGQLGTSLYPSTVPPVFNQHGGSVPTGFSLTMTNPNGSGTIFYTLDGGDPRLPGGGEAVPSSVGGSIIWVSDNKTGGADQAWIDLIKAETSFTVDETSFRNQEGRTLDSTKIATLNAANLIIVSRDISSGQYDDGTEPTDWNSITTPIILQSAHLARNSKWLWFDTTLIGGATPDMEAVVPTHPIFAGITLDMNDEVDIIDEGVGNVSSMTGGDAGTGELIARRADNNRPWIVYWEADETNTTEYYTGAGSSGIPKGNRLFFAGGTSSGNDGRENFNADGEQMFINAVNFMFTPIDPSFNFPPTVEAGDGQAVLWPGVSALLDATVSDDGKPAVPGTVTLTWSLQSGPVGVTFGDLSFDPNEFVEDPNVTFPEVGVYVLNLEASDGEKTTNDTVTVNILEENVLIYTGPITLTKSVQVKARVLGGGIWSALNVATFDVGSVADNLRITEIMYHPADEPAGDPNAEYIELQNVGAGSINLNLVQFTNGIDFTFGDVTLDADDFVVVVHNQAAFDNEYPTFSGVIAGEFFDTRLANGGERIRLADAIDATIHDFSYKDSWRVITDGEGFSLTIINADSTDPNIWDQREGWRASAEVKGSPGTDDSGIIPNPGAIVINEVLAHSDTIPFDFIELYNTTAAPIDLNGWYLSDRDTNPTKYEIKTGVTIIPAGGFMVFHEDLNFGVPGDAGVNSAFALSENGEKVILRSGEGGGVLTGYRNAEDFGPSASDIAFGRYQKSTGTFNFVAMSSNTPGAANASPKVGPVVISEIMYHPAGNPDAEYIELVNISGSTVTLYDAVKAAGWQITDGIDFTFPSTPVTLDPNEVLLLVKDLSAFNSEFPSAPPSVQKFEWSSGSLSNGGERVQLAIPGDLDMGVRQYIRIDRVKYDDKAPWPTQPDGLGESLTRTVLSDYGNDPANWLGAAPTPGL